MPYFSKKSYSHSVGLSCCFRQWRAQSHCRFLHGYAIKVDLIFGCVDLDQNGWVQDFGGLKPLKVWLEGMFDHKLMVAADDPDLPTFIALAAQGVAEVQIRDNGVGCEAFAKDIFNFAEELVRAQSNQRVRVCQVTVSEHEGNAATYMAPLPEED